MRTSLTFAAILVAAAPAHAREVYSMACEGKAVYFDTMDNNVTVTLFRDGKQITKSHVAEKVQKINGFVAIDVKTANSRMIFRFREHPVKGQDNNEALFIMPDSGGQTFQACTQ